MSALLLEDPDAPALRPLSRFRSIFALRDGIFTTSERLRIQRPGATLIYRHPDESYETLIAESEGFRAWSQCPPDERDSAEPVPAPPAAPARWLEDLRTRIEQDLQLLLAARRNEFGDASSPSLSDHFHDVSVHVVGPPDRLLLHQEATVLPGCIFDVRAGPILVDRAAVLSPFSFLEGPCYVAPEARLDNVRLTGGCIVGRGARLGGEVENSIVGDFSNKHHEGFVGHSLIAPWVNLGALATTSDLKNNYGPVRLHVPEAGVPDAGGKMRTEDCGTIKFGCLIGECAKVAIGTMLSTGTVLDAGANVFGGTPDSYVKPFAWGHGGTYELNRFLADSERIFARRQQTTGPSFTGLVKRLHPEA